MFSPFQSAGQGRGVGSDGQMETLRIVEIGAGTGGTTAGILPLLVDLGISLSTAERIPPFCPRCPPWRGSIQLIRDFSLLVSRSPPFPLLLLAHFVIGLSDRVEYVFTDISSSFLRKAEARFSADYPWVRYALCDISSTPLLSRLYGLIVIVDVDVV